MKGLLFDWDGTLVDSSSQLVQAWRHVARTIGKPFDEERFRGMIGRTARDIIVSFFDAEDSKEIDKILELRDAYYDEFYQTVEPFPEVEEILGYLSHQGRKMGIISSNDSSRIAGRLEELGWLPYFHCVIGAEAVSDGKPNPLIILVGAKRLGLKSDLCWVVGDSSHDVEAGNRAQATTILVCRYPKNVGYFDQFQPDYVLRDLLELKGIL